MQPFYMLKRILNPEFALIEKNMSLNLSLVKMPHSNFKRKATEFEAGVGRRSCGQTFECASERELAIKRRKGPAGAWGHCVTPWIVGFVPILQ